jgi:lipopolysaccharide transport system permease protein
MVIQSGRTEGEYCRDLSRYPELFYRDVLVCSKQTVIDVLWAVLRPFFTIVVFLLIFSKIAKLPAGGPPYAVMVFTAMLPWQLFWTSLSEGSISLISNTALGDSGFSL